MYEFIYNQFICKTLLTAIKLLKMRRSISLHNTSIKESTASWFDENIKKGDIFYQDIEILFENGKPKLQTHCGVLMGILLMAILISYTYMKANTMISFQDNKIQEPISVNYFGNDYEYDFSNGW